MEALISTLLALLNLSITYCMARAWLRFGYWLGMAAQVPWVIWDFATGNLGFLLIAVATVTFNTIGLRRLRKERRGRVLAPELDGRPAVAGCNCPVPPLRPDA